jgi:hypothetical protein
MTTRQAPARASARTAGNGAAACSEDWLRVQKTSEDGAAGHIHFVVAVTNGSATACTLSGYPTFEMLDQGGKILPIRVTHSDVSFPSSPPHKVLLAPRASASFDVGYSHVPVDPETSCPSASALLIRVTTEGKGLLLSQSMDPCNHGTVATSALKAGKTGTRG